MSSKSSSDYYVNYTKIRNEQRAMIRTSALFEHKLVNNVKDNPKCFFFRIMLAVRQELNLEYVILEKVLVH